MGQIGLKPLYNFDSYITERTRNFTGREWVFAEIDRWLAIDDAPHYFVLVGEPGIGKTAIAARLTQLCQVAAKHFCIARQADTLDPIYFTYSLSQQLSQLDDFPQALEEGGFHADIRINVETNYGQIVGLHAGNIIGTSTSADMVFNRKVVMPLKILYENGFKKKLVILVDALDEAVQQGHENISTLLANAQGLPSEVRFVFTSRPDSEVLRHFEREHIPYLLLNAQRSENLQDVREYIRRQTETSSSLCAMLAKQMMKPKEFVERVLTASQGNFLYVNQLLLAFVNGTQRFDVWNTLPKGLDGIYREFLRVRKVGRDIHSWRYYRPILGVLAAAQIPLTSLQIEHFTGLEEQAVTDVLQDIQQFLDPTQISQGQYKLYHQSIADFLSDKERAQEFWIDLIPVHKGVVTYYRGKTSTWEDVDWSKVDDYGLLHLMTHLYALKEDEMYRQELYELICKSYMREKYRRYASHRSFADNVLLSIEVAGSQKPPNLVQEIRGSILYAALGSLVSNVPTEMLAVLADIGQVATALGLAALIQKPEKQFEAYILISGVLLDQEQLIESNRVIIQALSVGKSIANFWSRIEAIGRAINILALRGGEEYAVIARNFALEIVEAISARPMELEEDSTLGREAVILSNIAQVLALVGEKKQAESVVYQAVERARLISWYWSRGTEVYETKVLALNAVVQALWHLGEEEWASNILDEAWQTAELINNAAARVIALSTVAQISLSLEREATAESIVEEILSLMEAVRDGKDKALVLSIVAQLLFKIEDKVKAAIVVKQTLAVVEAIEDKEDKVLALSAIAQVLSKIGTKADTTAVLNQALALVHTFEDEQNKAFILSIVAYTLSHIGEKAHAIAITSQALQASDTLVYGNKAAVLSGIAYSLARLKQRYQALKVIEGVGNGKDKAISLGKAAQGLAEAGENTDAVFVANQALNMTKTIANEKDKARAIEEIVAALTLAEQVDQALKVSKMVKSKVDRAIILIRMIQILAQLGKARQTVAMTKRALVVAKGIILNEDRMEVLNRLCQVLAWATEFDQALWVVQWIPDLYYQAVALREIQLALRSAGEYTRASDIADRIVDIREQDMRSSGDSIELALDVTAMGVADTDFLQDLLPEDRADTLIEICQRLAQIGEFKMALDVALQIENKQDQGIALSKLAQAQAMAKKIDQSLKIIERIEDRENRSKALKKVGQIITQQGHQEQALNVLHSAMATARLVGLESVLGVLEYGAVTLGTVDCGQTLWRVYEVLLEIENWWGMQ